MTLFKGKYRIESARLRGWDYASAGWYYITVCTRNRVCFLGDVAEGIMHLSPIGEIVAEEWQKTETIRPNVELDEWIIMPNHLHGIIVLNHAIETPRRGVSTANNRTGSKPNSIGSIVGQFKSICTKRIWSGGFLNFAWQSRFHDHIIRDEESLIRIREYIVNNPAKWDLDEENPANCK